MDDRRKQLLIIGIGGLVLIGFVAAVLFLTTETYGRKVSRLHEYAATLPAFGGSAILPGADSNGGCPEVSDETGLPAIVSRRPDGSVDGLDAQSAFISALSGNGVTWQGTSDYAYTIVTYKKHTYEITFPSDDTAAAIKVTACD